MSKRRKTQIEVFKSIKNYCQNTWQRAQLDRNEKQVEMREGAATKSESSVQLLLYLCLYNLLVVLTLIS